MAAEIFSDLSRANDANGNTLSGATWTFYATGTTTPQNVYADAALGTSLGSVVTADSGGKFAPIYFNSALKYRAVLKDAGGSVIRDIDPVNVSLAGELTSTAAGKGSALVADDDGASGTLWTSVRGFIAYLRSSAGSAIVGFIAAGTGAVARWVQDKLRERVSVFDFMTSAQRADVIARTGLLDVTSAIQAAINAVGAAGGGEVFFPAGLYRITSGLTVGASGVKLVGASRWGTLIRQDTLSAGGVTFSQMFGGLSSMSFIYNGTPTTGATAIYVTNSYCTLEDFVIRSSDFGVHFYGPNAVGGKVCNFEILDYERAGIICESLNDVFIDSFIINAGNTTRGTLGGIRLFDKAEAVIVTNGDILLGAYSMTTDATVNGQNTRPAYNKFTNVYFDSAVNGVSLDKAVEFEFVNCWFSGGRSGSGNPGITLNTVDSISFSHTNFFNCGGHGALVMANAKRTLFDSCKAESNSVTAGAGVSHGFAFSANTTDFIVKGCIAHNGLYSGTQGYGVFVAAGTSDRYIIADNLVTGNATGGVSDGGSGSNKRVANNY